MTHLERLQGLLRDLFQFDLSDLDFGLYRLLHLKRAEIEVFLTEQLPRQVEEAFASVAGQEQEALGHQLDDLARQVREQIAEDAITSTGEPNPAYANIRLVQQYQVLRGQIASIQATEAHKAEIFNHLYSFFSRYYEEGDFIPRRRYGARESYAVPYDGQEVFFHWANRDQHYVKTAETFKDYTFRVETLSGAYRVRFVLAEATTARDNAKGDRRFFFPRPDRAEYNASARQLVLPFEYRLPTAEEVDRLGKNSKMQQALLEQAVKPVLAALPDPALSAILTEDQRSQTDREAKKPELPLLLKRLQHFAVRNTSDFFIHKNLRAFLRRELEFYLKDQVLHLEDLEGDFEARRRLLRVLHRLGEQVIEFLTQIEEAQKRLFEKKKFVLRADYLIPIQHVPRSFWPEILRSEEQLAQWQEWFALQPEEADEAFLEDHPTLVVDTRHFGAEFTRRLLECLPFADLDEATDGLLVHGDNYQALRLLGERYREQLRCIYIDPPYNTASSSILYKNNYRHASWITLMYDRLALLRQTLPVDGAIFVSIDKTERAVLEQAMDEIFGPDNRIEELIWAMNTNNSQAPNYSTNHEYVEVYARDRRTAEQDRNMFREPKPGFEEVMALVARLNPSYPPISVIEQELQALYEQHKIEYREGIEAQGLEWEDENGGYPWKGLFNYNRAEYRDATGNLVPEAEAKERNAQIWVWREDNIAMPATKQAATTREQDHPNWRFYRPLHPVTGKPCPHPKSGWKFAYADDADSPDRRSFVALDRDARIVWGPDENKMPQLKRVLHEVETNVGKSVFSDYSDGEKQTSAMFGRSGVFLAPKHADFVSRFILHAAKSDSTVLDCFGGSGSTTHAVIKLNRDDRVKRKFISVEMGEYFDTVFLPRIAKVIYAPEWKDGRPKRLPTPDEVAHTPRVVKVLRLESYEDALHNLAAPSIQEKVKAREVAYRETLGADEYRLRYLTKLPLEASETLLDLSALEHPFNYTLEILTDEGPRRQPVDLVETFNYLYGLRVRRLETWTNPADKRIYRVVQATDRDQRRQIMVVWRDMADLDPQVERHFLEARLQEMASEGRAFDQMLINGDTAAKGFESLDGLFKRLMTAGEGA